MIQETEGECKCLGGFLRPQHRPGLGQPLYNAVHQGLDLLFRQGALFGGEGEPQGHAALALLLEDVDEADPVSRDLGSSAQAGSI